MSDFSPSTLVGKHIVLPAGSILTNRWGYENKADSATIRVTRVDDGVRGKVTALAADHPEPKEGAGVVWMGYVGKLDDEHAKSILDGTKVTEGKAPTVEAKPEPQADPTPEATPEPTPEPAPEAPKPAAAAKASTSKPKAGTRSRTPKGQRGPRDLEAKFAI